MILLAQVQPTNHKVNSTKFLTSFWHKWVKSV